MFEKEVTRGRGWSTRAQITLFIIVGLVILFSFLMVIQLTDSVAKGKLKQEQEKVMSGGFRKEALRLYVQDCLEKSLEEGLVLLGKQGTIWSDQPGGIKAFVEGTTGVTDSDTGDRVVYGITKKKYLSNPEQYPCPDGTTGPDYCKYHYPDTTVKFGVLTVSDVTEDLRLYLKDQTIVCVEDFVEQKISSSAVVEREDLDLQLSLRNDGISVNAKYPLKFSLSGEEFFYLSQFDFFYPTKFKQFYRSAVEFPFQQDYNFVDYKLTNDNLLQDEFEYKSERDRSIAGMTPLCELITANPLLGKFTCSRSTFASMYRDLGVALTTKLEGAGDIFEYAVPSGAILKNKEYTFRIARQNRPPALAYVHQLECPKNEYDYLVIKGDDELGGIDIQLNAMDPDEEEPTYTFSESTFSGLITAPPPTDGSLVIDAVPLETTSQIYTIVATAQDSHNAEDTQDVRVLVDNELSTDISFEFPYADVQSLHGTTYYISKEDPVFLKLSFPKPRITEEQSVATLKIPSDSDWDVVQLPSGMSLPEEITYPLPSDPSRSSSLKDITYYSSNDIINIQNPSFFSVSPFRNKGDRLDLTLNYEVKYCGKDDQKQTSTSTAITYVVDCVPHRNAAVHSYPYNGNTNAFLADHTCCLGELNNPQTWRLALDGRTCYTNPASGCYGKIEGYALPYEGYILERQLGVCDGIRGNTCTSVKREFADGPLSCGNVGNPSCKTTGINPINSNCYSQSAWGLVTDPDGVGPKQAGWCYGIMGCTQFCSSTQGGAIVQVDATLPTPKDNALNAHAKTNYLQGNDIAGKLACGCTKEYSDAHKACDANFDGTFEGTCQPEGGTYKCKL